jgi:hypothetical protein
VLATQPPENAFFEFFLREVSTTPPPARPIYPRGGDPSPSAPGQTAQHRQQGRPCQNQGGQIPGKATQGKVHTPGRWASCTGQIRTAAGVGGRNACMLRVQRFYALVRLILNILLTCTFNHV